MKKPIILEAFDGTNRTVPVWFMRQAGRYLPEYQAIKAKHSLQEMFETPELAAKITCQPIKRLGVDAAILFADILSLPSDMGFRIVFDNQKGPVIENCLQSVDDLDKIHDFDNLSHVTKTIHLVKEQLRDDIPLIGFAGSPFTVLTYLIEGGSSTQFLKTFQFAYSQPDAFQGIMDLLTNNTIKYLKLQKEAGVDLIQLFDSWGGILRAADYARWVLPHVQKIFDAFDLPSIFYVKSSNHLLPLMNQSGADFLSVDQTVVLGHHQIIGHTSRGIQGNLFNGLLYAGLETLSKEVHDVLIGGTKHPRYIFNLSHGVLPDTKVETLQHIVEQVHAFPLTHE